jgi:DHA1 family multidrug resistance protein-like MFS transporter
MRQYVRFLCELPSGAKRFIATEVFLGIGMGIVAMVLNLHFLSLGLHEEDIGRITSYGNLLQGVISLPAGWLADRLGRKRLLVTGLLLMSMGICGYGLNLGMLWLYGCQTAWSVGMAFLLTSEIQLLFQYCADRTKESQAYGLVFATYMLFSGVGMLLGGYLPNVLEGGSSVYSLTLFSGAISISVCVTLRALLLPSKPSSGKKMITGDDLRRSRRWPTSKLWVLSAVIFMVGFLYNLLVPYFNIIVKYRMDWSDGSVSLLLTITSVFHFIGSMLMSYVRERWNARIVYTVLFASNFVLVLVLAAALPPMLFAGLFAVRGGVYTLLHNLLESETMSAVEEEDRNRFAAMRSVFRACGGALAAYVTGWILSMNRYELPFVLTGLSMLATYVLLIRKVIPLFETTITKHSR